MSTSQPWFTKSTNSVLISTGFKNHFFSNIWLMSQFEHWNRRSRLTTFFNFDIMNFCLASLVFSFLNFFVYFRSNSFIVLNQKWKQQYKSQFDHWNRRSRLTTFFNFDILKFLKPPWGLVWDHALLLVWRLVKNWVAILTSQTNTETTCSNKNWENRRPAVTLKALYFESWVLSWW